MFLRNVSTTRQISQIHFTAKLSHVHICFEGERYGHVADECALRRFILIVCEDETALGGHKR